MIDTSAIYRESVRYSRTLFTEVDIVLGGVVLENDIPINDGRITTDRGSNTRYSSSLEVPLNTWQGLPFNTYGTRLRVWTGVESIGVRERIQVGEYQIFDYKRTNRGMISVVGKGKENILIEDRFATPYTPTYGRSTIAEITNLILASDPRAEIVSLNSYDRVVTATAAVDKERWSLITKLATSIQAEVFCGHDGRYYIVDAPALTSLVPVFTLDVGPTGVVIEQQKSTSRQGVYNAFSVSGSSSDTSVPAVHALVVDDDPASPTYYYGEYGRVTRFYTSQFFTSVDQCMAYALRLRAESRAANSTLSVGASSIPMLEAGDPVLTRTLSLGSQGTTDASYLLQKTELSLGNGNWSAEMLSDDSGDADEDQTGGL